MSSGPELKQRKADSGAIPVALVGAGRIGAVHLKNILANPRFELRFVVDINMQVAQEWASRSPHAKAVATIEEALQDKELRAVVICSPTANHPDAILKSLRAHVAVMCEKPISFKVKEIDECYEEAKKQNTPLLCAYQRRSDPSCRALKEACASGKVGQLQIVRTISRDHPVPTIAYLKISGKIFHDCGSHDLDVCRWLLGEDPTEVFAVGSAFNPEIGALHDWDTVMITLKYASGAIASVDLARNAVYGYDQRIEVLGSQGMVQANNKQNTTVTLATENGLHTDPFLYSFPQRYSETYALELDHFANVVEGKEPPRLSHADVRAVAIVADAAERSCETGQKVHIKY